MGEQGVQLVVRGRVQSAVKAARVGVAAVTAAVPVVVPGAVVHLHRVNQQAVAAQVDLALTCRVQKAGVRSGVGGGGVAGLVFGKTGGDVHRVRAAYPVIATKGLKAQSFGVGQHNAELAAVGHFGRSDIAYCKCDVACSHGAVGVDIPHQLVPIQPGFDVGGGGFCIGQETVKVSAVDDQGVG